MMLTMLPMSAFAADPAEGDLDDLVWAENDTTYQLSADTTVKNVVKVEGDDYTLNLDTYSLKVSGFDIASGSSLAITAPDTNKKGIYALNKDVTFTLGGNVEIGQYVIFKDAVIVKTEDEPAPMAMSVTENTFSGQYEKDLTIESGVTATLKDATVTGDVVVKGNLTVSGNVVVDGSIKVDGELTLAEGAKVDGKVEVGENGTVKAEADATPYTFTVGANGFVDVYAISADAAPVKVEAGTTTLPVKGATTKLAFYPDDNYRLGDVMLDSNKKLDVASDNTYTLTNDTDAHTVSVAFDRIGGGGSGGGSSGYSVNVASTTNGTVTVSPKNASKGATVTVTAKPDKGYVLDTLTVTDKDGKKIDLTDKGDNKFTFVMPAGSVTVKATFKVAPKTPFTDVAESAWYADAVAYVYENGMMKGTSDTKFSPEQTTTRGMIVTILYRLEKEPSASAASFTDVASGKYYSKAVAWASANKIVTGYGDGKFGPDDTITREQMAAILYRYASYKGYDVTKTADLSKFTDASQVGVFAKAAMQWANAEGLINGTSTTKLSPKSGATRAEVATILMRFCENIAK